MANRFKVVDTFIVTKRNTFKKLAFLLIMTLASCVSKPVQIIQATPTINQDNKTMETNTKTSNETVYVARDTGQIVIEGDYMRIGVGNLQEEEYTDSNNVKHTGTTAGLWFFVRGHPDLEQQVRVHEGQVLEVIGHKIRVIEIDSEDRYVALGIIPPDSEEHPPVTTER